MQIDSSIAAVICSFQHGDVDSLDISKEGYDLPIK